MRHRTWRGLTWPAAIFAIASVVYAAATHNPVHVTPAERTRPLPGDALIPQPIASLTHAITVRVRRQDLWPWIVQMGAGRGGWYSYDFIDNGGQPSTEEVLAQFQTIAVGDILPALPGATEGFVVIAYEPERFLVLSWPLQVGEYMSTWAFVLDDAGSYQTRLIVRGRASPGYHFHGLPRWFLRVAAPWGHYVMQRKQLLGIARRAERHTSTRY